LTRAICPAGGYARIDLRLGNIEHDDGCRLSQISGNLVSDLICEVGKGYAAVDFEQDTEEITDGWHPA